MKGIFRWIMGVAALSILTVVLPHQQAKAQPGMSVSFQMFYDELSPYGQWIDDPQYGYVWAPQIRGDFRPYYTNGRWVMTEYGNTWVSGYDWGWAPFHYGRWTYDEWYGWVWIPGDQWGPAWVDWRQGGGYYGWAPMGPGVNINISFGNRYHAPYDWWTFIPYGNMYSNNWHSYWRGPQYNTTIINQTTIINNYYNNKHVYGPRRSDIERHGGKVQVYQLRDNRNPGKAAIRRNEVAIYRPQVNRNERGTREAPKKVVRAERPIGERNAVRNNERVNTEVNRDRIIDNSATNRLERTLENRQIEREPVQRQNNDNRRVQQMQAERQREMNNERMRNEAIRGQREQEAQNQRMQMNRQRAEETQRQRMQIDRQRAERENVQRMQIERQRQDNIRQQQMRSREQMEQRQQQQRIQMNRQQQQREWRRPEPQTPQPRIERRQMERPQRTEPIQQTERPGRGR